MLHQPPRWVGMVHTEGTVCDGNRRLASESGETTLGMWTTQQDMYWAAKGNALHTSHDWDLACHARGPPSCPGRALGA